MAMGRRQDMDMEPTFSALCPPEKFTFRQRIFLDVVYETSD